MGRNKFEYKRKVKLDPLIAAGVTDVHFLDIQFLNKFVTESGKILPRRITGCTARSQKKVTKAIKRARNIGLLPLGRRYERN